jgi:hypothetical protein
MERARFGAGMTAGVLLLSLTGCARSTSAAEDVARQFVQAVSAHDGTSACSLLTPAAAQSAGGVAKLPCAKAILHLSEQGADVSDAQVWGDAAIVDIGSDTVFLRRLPAGWRVSAAGCTKRPDAPYDCDLEA